MVVLNNLMLFKDLGFISTCKDKVLKTNNL